MSLAFPRIPRQIAQAGAGLVTIGLISSAAGQTLPVAGNAQQAVARDQAGREASRQRAEQDRDGIRGVREQDNAARRTSNLLNRDARQEARAQATVQSNAQGQAGSLAAGGANLQSQANLRGPDLGIWLTNVRGDAGLMVSDIADQSVFMQAGLQEGDRILSINGRPVTSETQFVQSLLAPGNLSQRQSLDVVVFRNGQQQRLSLQPSLISQGIIQSDPFYQTGLLVDQSNPNQLVVQQVFPRTPAFYAGLRPGDVITGLNGQPITSPSALSQALSGAGAADLALSINRNGQPRQLSMAMSGSDSLRTAMRPNFDAAAGATADQAIGTSGAGVPSSANAGVGSTGTGTAGTGIGGQGVGGTAVGGLNTGAGGAATGPIGTSNPAASAITSPATVTTPTSPSLGIQPGTGARTATPGARTAVPGLSPAGPAGAGTATGTPGSLGTSGAGVIPSTTGQGGNFSTASPTNSPIGSPSAVGGTGTTGGTGATAGGLGATGGTGALPGGTGSTAGPSGGATGTGSAGVGTGGTGAGASGTGAGAGAAGAGAGGTGAGSGAGGSGGAGGGGAGGGGAGGT